MITQDQVDKIEKRARTKLERNHQERNKPKSVTCALLDTMEKKEMTIQLALVEYIRDLQLTIEKVQTGEYSV